MFQRTPSTLDCGTLNAFPPITQQEDAHTQITAQHRRRLRCSGIALPAFSDNHFRPFTLLTASDPCICPLNGRRLERHAFGPEYVAHSRSARRRFGGSIPRTSFQACKSDQGITQPCAAEHPLFQGTELFCYALYCLLILYA